MTVALTHQQDERLLKCDIDAGCHAQMQSQDLYNTQNACKSPIFKSLVSALNER